MPNVVTRVFISERPREIYTDTRRRGERRVEPEAGVMGRKPKNAGIPRSWKRQGAVSPLDAVAGSTLCQHLGFWMSGLQNCERLHFCSFKSQIFW